MDHTLLSEPIEDTLNQHLPVKNPPSLSPLSSQSTLVLHIDDDTESFIHYDPSIDTFGHWMPMQTIVDLSDDTEKEFLAALEDLHDHTPTINSFVHIFSDTCSPPTTFTALIYSTINK